MCVKNIAVLSLCLLSLGVACTSPTPTSQGARICPSGQEMRYDELGSIYMSECETRDSRQAFQKAFHAPTATNEDKLKACFPNAYGRDGQFGNIPMKPELMAMGDSLINGMQTGSMSHTYAATGPVAQLAKLIKVDFALPAYPTDYRIGPDLDALVRSKLKDLIDSARKKEHPRVIKKALRDLRSVLKGDGTIPNNPVIWPDNVATAGAITREIMDMTPQSLNEFLDRRQSTSNGRATFREALMQDPETMSAEELTTALKVINALVVLDDPLHNSARTLTQLEHVYLRKPKTLILATRNNDGALHSVIEQSGPALDKLNESSQDARDLLGCLNLIEGIETIYVLNLPKPSTIASTFPIRFRMKDTPTGHENNWDILIGGDRKKTTGELSDLDEDLSKYNISKGSYGGTQTLVADNIDGNRGVVVDIFSVMGRFDKKGDVFRRQNDNGHAYCEADAIRQNEATGSMVVRKPLPGPPRAVPYQAVLDNFPLHIKDTKPNLRTCRGGLYSMDHIHPSTMGYALMAEAIFLAMEERGDITLADLAARHNDGQYKDLRYVKRRLRWDAYQMFLKQYPAWQIRYSLFKQALVYFKL